jgi:succinate-semialdehyde dehydrogenase/glutarate-semialdehyde dehydrogenase
VPFVSINPTTGQKLASYRGHSAAVVERAVARAAEAQRSWGSRTVAERARPLRALARALRRERDTLAALATAEMGKPLTQARAEVEKSALLCDYYATHAARLLAPERTTGAPPEAQVVFDPLGTVLVIMPWNFPIWQVIRAIVPTLVAGNAVLVKPAATVAGSSLALEALARRAGLPPGLFQLLLIENDAVPALLADRRVHGVTLTGSTRAGKAVAALAGAAMKPGVFELGGSDPAIVLADADLDHAAEICAQSRLFNSGQSCVCAKRFIVVRRVQREFEQRFTARLAARRVGDPADPLTDVGPLAREDLRTALQRQVTRCVDLGARVLLGGAPLPGPGFFYAPTVLSDVKPGMPAYEEELFGPVAAIIPVRDPAEAIRVANHSTFGLGASLFTRNRTAARTLARQIEAGSVFVNDLVRSSPELPFGGIKDSGYGRELGGWGSRAFVNVKTVWTRLTPSPRR